MPAPCQHRPTQPATCPLCRLYEERADYRALWDGPRPAPSPLQGDCLHLGAETGERRECESCQGRVELKLRGCALHGHCTTAKPVPGVACCAGCPDRRSDPLPESGQVVRNLLYHVYPRSGNGVWQRNVGQLLRRIRLFNGRRVVAILTGPGCDPPSHVRDQFGGHVHEFLEIANDPALREVATFEPLFSRVDTTDPTQVTFYAHAKGVTRPPRHIAHPWTETMYEVCLDYWPHVERCLRTRPVAGPFLKIGHGWPLKESRSDWHYSGSFWWLRNRDLFAQPDWRRIDRFWSGIEPYLSLHFGLESAGCLFHPGRTKEVQPHDFLELYDRAYWTRRVFPDLHSFRERHAADRRDW